MRERQIEFHPNQTHVSWLTPVLLGICAVCIVVVIILLYTKEKGSFIGPW
jgi:hypothetical protein